MTCKISIAVVALSVSLFASRLSAQNPLPSAIPPVKVPAAAGVPPETGSQSDASDSTASPTPEANEAERAKLWASPEMVEARAWLQLYFARAKAITPQQSQDYMAQLEKLPAPQLTEWLGRYQQERQRAKVSQENVERARQLSVEAALATQQRMQQSYSNINRRQGVADISGVGAQRRLANERSLQNAQSRDATVIANTPGAAFNTGPYYLAFPPYAPYFAAATTPFPDGTANLTPREQADLADIQRSTAEPGAPVAGAPAAPAPANPPGGP